MYMKTNPKVSNEVLIYLNTTFKSTLRNSTKFDLNKYNAINRILAVNADSFSALSFSLPRTGGTGGSVR